MIDVTERLAGTSEATGRPSQQQVRHLHIGCGRSKWDGSIGVDICSASAADVLADLDHVPWPFADATFDEVIAIDVLEHLQDILRVMSEIHRVLAPGGRVTVRVPGASSHHQVTDPTHTHAFTSKSFQYFTDEFQSAQFSYSAARFTVEECRYQFTYNRTWLDHLVVKWVNSHIVKYERRFLYWYQIPELHFVLRKPTGPVSGHSS